jgi:hypothetical protein
MAKRRIRTIADLQRALDLANRRSARLYGRPYVLGPALTRNLARFNVLQTIDDAAARFEAFRQIPALEADLKDVWSGLSASERESLAQQDRARHPRIRLTPDGLNLEAIIRDLVKAQSDPWKPKAKQYWLMLIDRLSQMGFKPSSPLGGSRRPLREQIHYSVDGKTRPLSEGQFGNLLSDVRRERPLVSVTVRLSAGGRRVLTAKQHALGICKSSSWIHSSLVLHAARL